MSGAHVHARIYAFCTLRRRLHSISSTQTNTLTYTRHHTVANTVTHAPFTYRHKFWSFPRLAGFVSQATMLYKCLLDISTRFRPLEPSPAMSSLFECLSAVQQQFKLSFIWQPFDLHQMHSNIDSNVFRTDCIWLAHIWTARSICSLGVSAYDNRQSTDAQNTSKLVAIGRNLQMTLYTLDCNHTRTYDSHAYACDTFIRYYHRLFELFQSPALQTVRTRHSCRFAFDSML